MLILSIGGGALAAYFASSYGIWAAIVAYVTGGALFSLVGLLSSRTFWQPLGEDDEVQDEDDFPHPEPEDGHHSPVPKDPEKVLHPDGEP
jgi:hypothetical protein